MPFPHIVKVFNLPRLIVKNRKLANKNRQLKRQILNLSNKLSSERKEHSKANKLIGYLNSQLELCDEHFDYLNSQLEEKGDSIFELELQLKKCNQLINDQANEIDSSNKLIRDIYNMLQESRKCDF